MCRCSLPLLFLAICTVACLSQTDTKQFAARKLRKNHKWWPFQKSKSMISYRINEVLKVGFDRGLSYQGLYLWLSSGPGVLLNNGLTSKGTNV